MAQKTKQKRTVKQHETAAAVKAAPEEKKSVLFGLREREIILFLLLFLLVSALLLGAWYYIGPYYQKAVFAVARVFLLLMGYNPSQIAAVNIAGAYLGNFNLVPLVALAIATPRLAPRQRLVMLGIGIPLLFLLHVLDLVAHFPLYFHGSKLAEVVVYSIGVGGVALPFIIWFVLCYARFFKGARA
ncbi:MAG TPA: hypothetical protein ENN68_00920 [Methanomicrobia archaeon]|nr:hypothetical protein [Methanomicrobia archaeon]